MSRGIPPLTTRLGHAGWNQHELRGVMVFDLVPERISITELMLLTIGMPATDEDARTIVTLCAQASLNPDPRIPPMKLARLGSAYGSLVGALGAAFVGLHGSHAGMSALIDAAKLMQELEATLGTEPDDDALDAALHARRKARLEIFGFGVPGRPTDERVPWFAAHLDRIVRGPRPWWRLFERMSANLTRYHRKPNFAGAAAAALLDLGCTPEQIGALGCLIGLAPLVGNVLEGSVQAPEILRELPAATAVEYDGRPPRTSPRARREEPGLE